MSKIAKILNRVMELSRDKKLKHFYSLCKEGDNVLDVGVSRELKWRLPATNYFLKNYRYDSTTYTGLGVENLQGMEVLFPGKRFVRYPGGQFPFSDHEFDWVFSNAVIEHVGDEAAQISFINEMLRVSRSVFMTTPNKYFPFESHTRILFLHWHNGLFRRWCTKKAAWVIKDNIQLLSYHRLRKILKQSNATSFAIFKNRFWGIPMTFTVVCR